MGRYYDWLDMLLTSVRAAYGFQEAQMRLFKKQEEVVLEKDELVKRIKAEEEDREFFLRSIRTLLVFIKRFSLDIKEIDSDRFKKGIDELTQRYESEEKTRRVESFFEKQKKAMVVYVDRLKRYLQDRENEFRDIIELLTKAMVSLDAENQGFYKRVYGQAEKIERITELDDIKKIRSALTQEVEEMRGIVSEKEARDMKQISSLSDQVKSLKRELEKAKTESVTDGLTGVYNRKAFDDYIKEKIESNMVRKSPFSLLILDIDDFKKVNDTYGHHIGDRVLLACARKFTEPIRADDFLARYGGEEFVIVLPKASLRNAVKKAKEICKATAESKYMLDEGEENNVLAVTVSIGVSAYRKGDTAATLIERADQALYMAKQTGKNCVVTEKVQKKPLATKAALVDKTL